MRGINHYFGIVFLACLVFTQTPTTLIMPGYNDFFGIKYYQTHFFFRFVDFFLESGGRGGWNRTALIAFVECSYSTRYAFSGKSYYDKNSLSSFFPLLLSNN